MLGRACFDAQVHSLPPGSQYEGIEAVDAGRLTIKVMNGVEVTTVECGLRPDGTLDVGGGQ